MKTITPTMHGIIDRRMLVNFHVRPDAIQALLPPLFKPKLVDGWAMAGICLIRLKHIRPRGFPVACGLTSENAAHRIAVEWHDAGTLREGVFIPRRDTSSTLQTLVGGRLFPGVHRLAQFDVRESAKELHVRMRSRDRAMQVEVQAHPSTQIPAGSVFKSLAEAARFFERGSAGYSVTKSPDRYDGLELHTSQWPVEPLEIESVRSSFFDDLNRFPKGTIYFDCALLMSNVAHEWRVLPRMEK
jgi:uncharacterized protein YqjF (DUF2071 family)